MTDSVVIGITPTVTPSVNVTSVAGDTLCQGTPASFTTTIVNGGTSPAYQWKVNGVSAGSGTSSYSYTPVNGDVVSVLLTSNATCAVPDTAGNSVVMTVISPLVPGVAISASPGSTIVKEQTVTFTATVTNGGPAPTYQWEVNGVAVPGATTSTFVSGTLSNGDIVTCAATGSGQCGVQPGNGEVTMTVTGNVGVNQLVKGDAISGLPNPNKGDFTVTGTLNHGNDDEVDL